MALIYLRVVALPLRMTLNKSPFDLRESPVMLCVARPPGFVFPKPISVIFHIFVYTKCAPTVVLVVLCGTLCSDWS